MQFRAIASDYDCTLAEDGRVLPKTINVLRRCRESGCKLILNTGRELADLRTVFTDLQLFDLVIAENGALILDPVSGDEFPLCAPPPADFLRELRDRCVPFTVGKCVLATVRPYEIETLLLIKQMNLDLDVAFNRESVMVLPSGINKGTGLAAAVVRLGMSLADVVGIGDAENDLPFLSLCGFSVAVANSIDALKSQVDMVTRAEYGAGVAEIVDRIARGATLTPQSHHLA